MSREELRSARNTLFTNILRLPNPGFNKGSELYLSNVAAGFYGTRISKDEIRFRMESEFKIKCKEERLSERIVVRTYKNVTQRTHLAPRYKVLKEFDIVIDEKGVSFKSLSDEYVDRRFNSKTLPHLYLHLLAKSMNLLD